MRKLIFLIFLALLVAYAKAQSIPVFNEKDSTIIKGMIKFYDPVNDEKMISFRAKDLAGKSISHTSFINRDGSFRCSILQPFAGNFGFIYKKIYTEIYGEPGEEIGLTIHNNRIDSTRNLPVIFEITGKSSPISRGMLLFNNEKSTSLAQEQEPNSGDKGMTDEEFSMKTRNFRDKEMGRLNDFLEKHHLKGNIVLKNWLINKIVYSAASDIVFNPFLRSNPTMTPAKLIEFLGDLPVYREGAFHNSEYYRFLQSLSTSVQICVNTNPSYRSQIRASGNNGYPVYLKQIDSLELAPSIKEMLYYATYHVAMDDKIAAENAFRFQNLFDKNIQSSYLKKEMVRSSDAWAKKTVQVDILDKIRRFATTESIRQRLMGILETATKNRYAFIDFWGSWCAPCMGEMPYYSAFIDTCRNKPVNFLFLSCQTSDADAKQTKEKFGINATFINLSDDEIQVLNQIIGFTSYPSHFVLAPGGMLIGRYNSSVALAMRNRTSETKEPIQLFSLIK